jgi:peroxiredoxin
MIDTMRSLVIVCLALPAVGAASVAIRSGCDEADSTVGTVDETTPLHVNSAVAGFATCYSVTAVVGQQRVNGYTVDSTLPAVVDFERERRAAFSRATAAAAAYRPPPQATAAPPPVSRFPDFETRDLSGKPLHLPHAKVFVVTFWSPSNRKTLAQLMSLRALYSEFHQAGLGALGVAMNTSDNAARAALDDNDLDWPQISDQMGLARALNINRNEATTLVLDANRNIVASGVRGPELTALVTKMLKKTDAAH